MLVTENDGVMRPTTLDDFDVFDDFDDSADFDDSVQLVEDAVSDELGKMVMTENGPVAPGSKRLELADVRSLVEKVVQVVSRDDAKGQRVISEGRALPV